MPHRPPTLRARAPSRRSTTKHGHLYRSSRWKRASKSFRSSPKGALCAYCSARGLVVPSAIVDHVNPHNGDLALFWDSNNWQGLCWSCHSAKSSEDRTGRQRQIKGCDQNGMPLDPSSPWRQP